MTKKESKKVKPETWKSATWIFKGKKMNTVQFEEACYNAAIKGEDLTSEQYFKAWVYGGSNQLPLTEKIIDEAYGHLGMPNPEKKIIEKMQPVKAEPTKVMRIPESLVEKVKEFIRKEKGV